MNSAFEQLAENPAPAGEQLWPQIDYRLGGDRARFARYGLAGLAAGRRVDYTVAATWYRESMELEEVL